MRYYTTKGDSGATKLFNCPQGVRISKGSDIFEVLGGVDELNSLIGWCRAVAERSSFQGASREEFLDALLVVQEDLFVMQAELGGSALHLTEEKVRRVEGVIARFAGEFPAVHSFVIPGATELGALLDVSRTIARRVERLYIRAEKEARQSKFGSAPVAAYLNRLSSLLYVLARYANHAHGVLEKVPSYA
jgi:cob(I)alamin adenosyltransferase